MWNRKELKTKAKKVVHQNYWTAIVVCFLIAVLTGEFGTSIISKWQIEDSMDPNYVIHQEKEMEPIKDSLDETQTKIFEAIEANLNSATKPQKYIFKIWDAIASFHINQIEEGIGLCMGAIIALSFTIFIADPLIVGGKKYFLKAREQNNTKITIIGEIFQKENWMNIAIIMLLRNIYNALWYLTIVGGIIKTYEYRMIPYILAQNPKIKRKQAFQLSKQMMKGNKWKTFLLDLSFFGWNLLSVLTCGILSILYVNPYNVATITELYKTLEKQAIHEKYEYYESLQ